MADILSIGRSGLNAAKKSLETTSHNISNVNTEGYSRQKVVQTSNVPTLSKGVIQGTGARVIGVRRTHDPYIEKRLRNAESKNEYFGNRHIELDSVQNLFNEIDNEGLNNLLGKFFNAFRELANQPEDTTIRSVVRDKANIVTQDFRRIRTGLNEAARSIDRKMRGQVEDINNILRNIADLNVKVADMESSGDETSDLRDKRDLLIRELSKNFRIHVYNDDRYNMIVSAVGVGTLVSAGEYQELTTSGTHQSDSSNKMDGSIEVFFKNRPSQKITDSFKSGSFTSLIKVRNGDIKNLQEKVDQIAFDFANAVNALHRRGYVNRQVPEGQDGSAASVDNIGATTGINFFKVTDTAEGAAELLSLSDEVEGDLTNIAAGLAPNSPGDNRVALAISKLQHEKFLNNGTATIEEHYLKAVGHIGIETGKAQLDSEQTQGILIQMETLRERNSGVSLDEETANMVRYQHAYNASAKVLQTANEMFDTVLSIKR